MNIDQIKELTKKMKPELERIQLDMYHLGKKDALKSLIHVMQLLDESFYTKENILQMIRECLTALDKAGYNKDE